MCKACYERGILEFGHLSQDDDRMKVHDSDVKDAVIEGFSAVDMLMVAYDTLEENPEDANARNIFISLAMIHYRAHPVRLYQEIRESRENVLDVVMKNVN